MTASRKQSESAAEPADALRRDIAVECFCGKKYRVSRASSARRTRNGQSGTGDAESGTSFFGKTVAAKSVAYVIDASGSMQGPRFVRARMELVNALMKMKKTQEFFIVFYTDQTYPLFWPQSVVSLIPANAENLKKTGLWLELARTSDGTQPQEAMSLALSLKPDVIFLLSDGDIPDAL